MQKTLFCILLWLPLSLAAQPVERQSDHEKYNNEQLINVQLDIVQSLNEQPNNPQFDGVQPLDEQPINVQFDGVQPLDEQPINVYPIKEVPDSLCEHVNPSLDLVIVGVDEYPPWSYLQDNKAMGIDVDLIRAAARQLNISVTFVFCFWAQCLEDLKTGKIEILPNVYKLPERESYFDFIEPAYLPGSISSIYKKTSSSTNIENFDNLTGLTVGLQESVEHFDRLKNSSSIKRVNYESNSQLMQALLDSEVDAIVGDKSVFDYMLKNEAQKYASIKRQRFEVFIDEPGYLAVSKCAQKANIWQQFSQQIIALGNQEFVQKALSRYND